MPERRPIILALLLVILASGASAQVPEEFTNLQLLDPDIEKGDLVATMRDWAGGLGVRCNYCHVGPDDLVGMDFASDEKATKRTARRMLEMARRVNRELLGELPTVVEAERGRAQVVSCFTCHRGQPRPPRNILRVLGDAAVAGGAEAVLETYAELRREHLGAGVYDFRAATLDRVARRFAQSGDLDAARRILEANLEEHPDSIDTLFTLALVERQAARIDAARQALERALALDPGNRAVRAALESLAEE